MPKATATEGVIEDLGDGLVMRRAGKQDAEALARFHGEHLADPPATFDDDLYHWMLDLMSGEHPTFRPADFLLVEDTTNGKIASSLCLISQEWEYEGVPFKVGQPEIVSTHPDYRRRSLVRRQFEEIHRWSAERGELVQAIGGIYWYYRQFGYELALPMGDGRTGYKANVPPLKESEEEPYRLRPATEADIPFIAEMYAQQARRTAVSVVRDEAQWRYEIGGHRAESGVRTEQRIIETGEGKAVGLLIHTPKVWGDRLAVMLYELTPNTSWATVTPSVLRYLAVTGTEYAGKEGKEWGVYQFKLGTSHPVYRAVPSHLPQIRKPYAWYMRVPDLPGFIRHIAPALDKRLARSIVSGTTAVIKLNFYRSGLLLTLEEGKLTGAEGWQSNQTSDGDAGFPGLTFLQLLFGFRSLEDLEYAFPDCWVNNDQTRALLEALFPRRPSNVWSIQ